jgi:hypothetical protein
MRYLIVNTQLTPNPTSGSTSKQTLLLGQRITGGKLILSQNGFSQPDLYKPLQVPSFATGTAATNYLAYYGLVTSIGINFTLDLPAPTTVSNVGAQTILTWSSIPAGFSQLTGFALAGILSQDVINGSVVSAQIISGVATLTVQGNVAFVTAGDSGDPLVLSGLNNVQYPDPNISDPITLMTWDYYQTALSAAPPTQGTPSSYLSILSDRDTTINANPAPFNLPAPNSVQISGSTATLTYTYTSGDVTLLTNQIDTILTESGLSSGLPQYYIANLTNFGYLPTTAYGSSSLTQNVTLPSDSTQTLYYANGVYLRGSADSAGIDHSTDGINWVHSNITTHTVNKFYWNGSVYVACTNAGLYYSVNGSSWTVSSINSGIFTDIYFANTKWVTTSTAGLFYSSDGITWTGCSGDDNASFTAITYGVGTSGGVWVAVTASADAYNSTDGITFAALTLSTAGFFSAYFANGLFQLGGNTTGIVYSTDGTTFTPSNLTTLSVKAIAFNSTLDVWNAATTVGIYYSTNGIAWTITTGASSGSFTSLSVNGTTLIAGSGLGVYHSANGTTWALSSGAGATGAYVAVLYANNIYLAGYPSGIIASYNGSAWNSGSTTATATFNGYTINPTDSGGTVVISLSNVVGGFNTLGTIAVSLDNTLSVFDYLDNINLYGAVLQFPITTLSQITTTQAAFYNGITAINNPNEVLNNHYLTYGAAGNISVLPSQASTLPNRNNNQNILVTYPYVAQFGNIPYENTAGTVAGGRVTSAVMYMLANGDTPYPSLGGSTINHLPVSSIANTTSYQSTQGGTGDIAVNQGWMPLAPNSGGVVQILQSNTTLTTIPNTTTPDIEFRYTHIWDCVRWLKQQVAQFYQTISVLPNNAGSALISPQFIRQFRSGIIAILNQGQLLGVVENVEAYQNLVRVTPDQTNPNQVDAYIPSQIIPQLNGANILINVFSSLYQFNNTATGV